MTTSVGSNFFPLLSGPLACPLPSPWYQQKADILRLFDSSGTLSSLWQCHNGAGPAPQPDANAHTFPTGITGCNAYPWFSGEMWFPFCWNGLVFLPFFPIVRLNSPFSLSRNNFDPAHPNAHVVHAANGDKAEGPCPPSHPRILPHLFVEFHHDIGRFDGLYGPQDHPWVLSSGDETGWGMHVDFVSFPSPAFLPSLSCHFTPFVGIFFL